MRFTGYVISEVLRALNILNWNICFLHYISNVKLYYLRKHSALFYRATNAIYDLEFIKPVWKQLSGRILSSQTAVITLSITDMDILRKLFLKLCAMTKLYYVFILSWSYTCYLFYLLQLLKVLKWYGFWYLVQFLRYSTSFKEG